MNYAVMTALMGANPKVRARRGCWPIHKFLYTVPGSVFKVNRPPLLGILPEGYTVHYASHVDVFEIDSDQGTATAGVYLPTQDDIEALDWSTSEALVVLL